MDSYHRASKRKKAASVEVEEVESSSKRRYVENICATSYTISSADSTSGTSEF